MCGHRVHEKIPLLCIKECFCGDGQTKLERTQRFDVNDRREKDCRVRFASGKTSARMSLDHGW
jgi:hypothetical protein